MTVTQTQRRETGQIPGPQAQAPACGAQAQAPVSGPKAQASVSGLAAQAAAGHAGPAGHGSADRRSDLAAALRPLLIDIGIPVGSYYLLRDAFGLSLWLSLALSSVGPAVRSVVGLVRERKLNLLAVLMLAVNLAGIGISFLTGDPRAMIAKDSIVSSVIAFTILGSVALRRPLMSAGLKPYMTRGKTERIVAWDRLSLASARFRRLELAFTTMVWLGTVMTLGSIGVAIVAGGAAAGPIQQMIDAEAAAS